MKFEVNIDKKHFFILLGAILILAGAIYGYAYGGNTPSVMGHTWGEIDNRPEGLDDGDDFEANTDTQDLSISGNTISLTNGGSVTLPSGGNSPVSGSVVGGGLNTGAYNSCGSTWGTGVYCNSWGDLVCPSGTTERSVGAVPEGSMGWVICVKN